MFLNKFTVPKGSMGSRIQKSDRIVKKAVKTFLSKICYKIGQNMYYGVSIESSCYSALIDTHDWGYGEKKNFRHTFLLRCIQASAL